MKFLHTMLRVADIEKSLKFYQKLFGLKVTRTKELEDATLYFLSDGISNVEIELTYNHETPKGGYVNGTSFGHLAFEIDNMDKFTEKLHALGYDYLYSPFILPGHTLKIAFVNDPDGREIEIVEH